VLRQQHGWGGGWAWQQCWQQLRLTLTWQQCWQQWRLTLTWRLTVQLSTCLNLPGSQPALS
jgi:hypothetical protein